MKKVVNLFFLFCFVWIIMSGCENSYAKNASTHRVVTQVDITCQHKDLLIKRHYTDSKKMESVLIYLRLLTPLTEPITDADKINADIYEITVRLSDGAQRIYRQKAHRYISKDFRAWKNVDPAHAAQLYALMRYYPSDMDVSAFAREYRFAQNLQPCSFGFCTI